MPYGALVSRIVVHTVDKETLTYEIDAPMVVDGDGLIRAMHNFRDHPSILINRCHYSEYDAIEVDLRQRVNVETITSLVKEFYDALLQLVGEPKLQEPTIVDRNLIRLDDLPEHEPASLIPTLPGE